MVLTSTVFTNFTLYSKNEGATGPRKNLRFQPCSTEYSILSFQMENSITYGLHAFQMEYMQGWEQ